ncbi:WD40-repeat-containing domain protein [Hygrophoropsis aurantiaca]|uniref:WD40-repeat-containing domain protein n=1 Tax=Hygrophoropsis aurantiaca TaxID=72124 RepID=A0ACB7ZUW0_9AGAM|nr:WD40-repeat-containing domain protein [Hygrophoropsis aurantiaca]
MSTSASPELEDPTLHLAMRKVFEGHTGSVSSVAYLKNGKQIVSGSTDQTIRIWNMENGKQESASMAHGSSVHSIAISPDEKTLVSGGSGMILWDLESWAVVWKTKELGGFHVAFSPDGQLIAEGHGQTIELLDVESGKRNKEPLQVGEYEIKCLAFSPNRSQLAVGSSDGKVRVFDVATSKIVVGPFKAHTMAVSSLAFTPDGKQFLTGSGDKSIRVWNSANGLEVGEPMLSVGPDAAVIHQIALSGDGRRLASVSWDYTVCIWDVGTRQQIGDPPRAPGIARSVAWSPEGHSVIAGDIRGNLSLWTVPPLEDKVTAPTLSTSSPPPPSASRSRANSLSSSILNLPAGPSATPPQPPEPNKGPGEDDNWEYFTNESFDSVLDLPADGKHPAQRRKRRRRRAAPVASTSSPPISVVPDAPPAIISVPRHSPPPPRLDQTPSPPAQTTTGVDMAADAPAPRVGALRRLWRQRQTLPRWTPRKNRDEPRESQPVVPSPAPDKVETQPPPTQAASPHNELAADHTGASETTKSRTIARLFTRSRRRPTNTTPRPENIEMHPPPSSRHRSRNPHTRPRRQSQSEVVNVAAGRLDQRLAASSNKWTDKIDWLDYICFCMCCPWNKVISESDSERQGNRTAAGAGAEGSSGSSSNSSVSPSPVDLNNIF